MSTMALVQGQKGVEAAWETDGQIYFSLFTSGSSRFSKPQAAPDAGRERKHPALAFNDRGESILVWTEETGWDKGGSLAWQVYDKSERPTTAKGRLEKGIPVWGLPTAIAVKDGFVIIH